MLVLRRSLVIRSTFRAEALGSTVQASPAVAPAHLSISQTGMGNTLSAEKFHFGMTVWGILP
jgi:hypothetical protein